MSRLLAIGQELFETRQWFKFAFSFAAMCVIAHLSFLAVKTIPTGPKVDSIIVAMSSGEYDTDPEIVYPGSNLVKKYITNEDQPEKETSLATKLAGKVLAQQVGIDGGDISAIKSKWGELKAETERLKKEAEEKKANMPAVVEPELTDDQIFEMMDQTK